ncbi:predicted protein [Nematostella vectensis]|uniref:Uncharacterized protein n=1 Tax=Nematostella vectensis TaxID=45351 RepID=A7SSA0_NEMVE|nr:uncharacterized protein LOC5504613 [Nematostella vectensis]EDO33408.1 predicted protein [Nematostella vectensis]|eukprot:XP_001625508.1 predicted protein [Nematostella vectensis]
MSLARLTRPLLRFYYRNPRLTILGIIILVVCLTTLGFPGSSPKIGDKLEGLRTLYSGKTSKPKVTNNDYAIPSKEYHFDEVKVDSSLFGGEKCLMLDYDPYSKAIASLQKDLGKLACSGREATKLQGHVLHVKGVGLQEVTYQSILPSKDPKVGFRLGDRMSVVMAQVQLTPGHSGSISHFLGKCVHTLGSQTRSGTQLVLYDECGQDKIEFLMEEDGTIRHKITGKCVGPKEEIAETNKGVVLIDRCDDSTRFKGLDNGFLQHMSSEMCVHFQSMDLSPPNDVPLVFYPDCEKNWKQRFGWASDFSKGKSRSTDTSTDVSEEFIKVSVQYAEDLPGNVESEYHMQVSPKFDLKEPKDIVNKPNVLVFMLHSASFSHFRRKMPKTFAFLNNLAGNVFFKGFSVFDESTKSQLSALFSGIPHNKIMEFNNVDALPWLHTLHKEKGYVTLMTEDKPCSPMFSDTLCDFENAPVDHFGSPFWAAAHKTYSPGQNTFCLGTRAIHNYTLGYIRDFMTVYKVLPKFGMVLFSELSSWNANGLGYLDEDFARFLAWMKLEGHLDKTVLTIFSDHGSRHTSSRSTLQGKLEERNPFLSITIPPKGPQRLIDALPTLRKNSKNLVTAYDVYATLRRIEPTIPKRAGGLGENLMEPLKKESRTCEGLEIPPQWCPCLSVKAADSTQPKIIEAGKKIIESVNQILSKNPEMTEKCSKVEFGKIKLATKLTPYEAVLKFKWSKAAGKCTGCEPVYGKKPDDMFYVLYVDSKQGASFRAIVNIAGKNTHVHPHIVNVKSKDKSCWKKSDNWQVCVCK